MDYPYREVHHYHVINHISTAIHLNVDLAGDTPGHYEDLPFASLPVIKSFLIHIVAWALGSSGMGAESIKRLRRKATHTERGESFLPKKVSLFTMLGKSNTGKADHDAALYVYTTSVHHDVFWNLE